MAKRKRAAGSRFPAGWLAVPALVLAACGSNASGLGRPDGDTDAEVDGQTASEPVELLRADDSPREDVPSVLDDMRDQSFPEPLIDPAEILSGGPPPDGVLKDVLTKSRRCLVGEPLSRQRLQLTYSE